MTMVTGLHDFRPTTPADGWAGEGVPPLGNGFAEGWEVIGQCQALRAVLKQVATVAPTDATGADSRRDGYGQGAHRQGDP